MINKLVVGKKWDKDTLGISYNEALDINLNRKINYMGEKYFLVSTEEDVDEFYINKTPDLQNTEFIITNKIYRYNHRLFVRKNHSFYCFIQKCKEYYANKMAYKKKPKQLLMRQLYGAYKS